MEPFPSKRLDSRQDDGNQFRNNSNVYASRESFRRNSGECANNTSNLSNYIPNIPSNNLFSRINETQPFYNVQPSQGMQEPHIEYANIYTNRNTNVNAHINANINTNRYTASQRKLSSHDVYNFNTSLSVHPNKVLAPYPILYNEDFWSQEFKVDSTWEVDLINRLETSIQTRNSELEFYRDYKPPSLSEKENINQKNDPSIKVTSIQHTQNCNVNKQSISNDIIRLGHKHDLGETLYEDNSLHTSQIKNESTFDEEMKDTLYESVYLSLREVGYPHEDIEFVLNVTQGTFNDSIPWLNNLAQLENFGFPKVKARQGLLLAEGNFSKAVELLLEGIED